MGGVVQFQLIRILFVYVGITIIEFWNKHMSTAVILIKRPVYSRINCSNTIYEQRCEVYLIKCIYAFKLSDLAKIGLTLKQKLIAFIQSQTLKLNSTYISSANVLISIWYQKN